MSFQELDDELPGQSSVYPDQLIQEDENSESETVRAGLRESLLTPYQRQKESFVVSL